MMKTRDCISTLVSHHRFTKTTETTEATRARPAIVHAANSIAVAMIGLLVLAGCNPRDLASSAVESGPVAESGGENVAVIIDGREITVRDVNEHLKEQFLEEFLQQPEERQFEMREGAIRDLVHRHILAAEAKKQGKTNQEIIDDIAKSVPVPSAEDVATWYSQNKERLRGARLEDVTAPIMELLVKERQTEATKAFFEPRLEALSWKMLLMPPRVELEATRLARGAADAPVTIMAFSDYQCPYCVRAEPVLAEVLKRYPDDVRVVHRHFPLDTIHPFARPAAEAAMCADEQGKFWEYHDGIFARQGKLAEGSFVEIGSEIGLDPDAFGSCVEERRYKDFVEADFAAGQEAGVTGTPSFFLNGIALKGTRDADELSRHVDLEMARIKSN
jgi:predicted DsbA family dithiol-disulfide isomerase